ncbi:MAG TPA: serine protease [Paracoccaceae bacterium]|nr:serine protease [Paracoccaceae bacterium]
MRLAVFLVGLMTALLLSTAARAQDRVWIQIEAQPTLSEAEARARAYASVFPDVAGFRLNTGWYAVVLGPYAPDAGAARLADLRGGNLIPADSFIALPGTLRAPFWPVGQDPAAQAPTPAAAAPAPVAPLPAPAAEAEETPADARRAEQALTRPEREQIQAALQWAGFYSAAIDGAFGPGTRASITAWQTARGVDPTGFLTSRQRVALLSERAEAEAALGLQTVTEPEAGIEFALPTKLVAFGAYEPPFVRYDPVGDSGVRLVLISQPGDTATLFGLYDMLQTLDAMPPEGPRTRADRSFTIEGANDRVASFAQAELAQGLVKGFLLTWDPARPDLAQRALSAIKASFRPVGTRALDPGLVALDEATRSGMMAGMEVRRPVRSRSGFYITPQGAVLTVPEAVDGCTRITLDRVTEADVTLTDPALGIAVLTPRAALAPAQVAGFEMQSLRPGAEVALAGYPYEDQLPSPTLTFGALAAATGLDGEPALRRLALPALAGDAGGPVLDASGAVVGMLLPRATDGARLLPPDVAFAAGAGPIAERLAAGGVTVQTAQRDGALAPEELTQRATRMTVLVSCWN